MSETRNSDLRRPGLPSYVRETPPVAAWDLMRQVEGTRREASRGSNQKRRAELGQYFTPASVALFMASMLETTSEAVSILDAGAGVGSLFAACVAEFCAREVRPAHISVTAYEVDPALSASLSDTVAQCRRRCDESGVGFSATVRPVNFIQEAAQLLPGGLFPQAEKPSFTHAILNPPYRKINARSQERLLLRRIGIETSNLYTGFLAAAILLLQPGADMVAITPRSFCNGTYFRPFREMFLCEMSLRRLHLFESREEAFQEDDVLQETIIVHAVKQKQEPRQVSVTSSGGADDDLILCRDLPYHEVVRVNDPERFIRVVPDGVGQQVVSRMSRFSCLLADLSLSVSTGRVVDFRAKSFLRGDCEAGAAPLLYPAHLKGGRVVWPRETRKPQAITVCAQTETLLIPSGNYVLVKRFSAKEEPKRVVASVLEESALPGDTVGLENHLNYYHRNGRGLDPELARGLSAFLNSTLVDTFFRQFNGHTQVNATDLRSLRYPTEGQLISLGRRFPLLTAAQAEVDRAMEQEFFMMPDDERDNPVAAKAHIEEALGVLKTLGFPKSQLNERSALTLLALVDVGPSDAWEDADNPLRGITPIMEFMEREYGKRYKPNTRETVRRQTMHQFLEAGLVVSNPDKPDRPVNSGQFVYQIEASALALLRSHGAEDWDRRLSTYLASVEALKTHYAQQRQMVRIPVIVAPGKTITLSPGGQNVLTEQIITEFCPRFTPGGKLLYIGDADEKFSFFDRDALAHLGVEVNAHGKMPDVIVHYTDKDWLVLIEAVTSHGPVNEKRKNELRRLFQSSSAGLVFVTAFLSRRAMTQYLTEISWETEVWVAEEPMHMTHFNGERFLGPY